VYRRVLGALGHGDRRVDDLIADFSNALKRRRKAIKHKGRLTTEILPDEGEAHVYVRTASGVRAIFRLHDGGYANVFLQRVRKPNRGRTLARLEGIRVPISGRRTVACLEETIALAASWRTETSESSLQTALREIWENLMFEEVDSR